MINLFIARTQVALAGQVAVDITDKSPNSTSQALVDRCVATAWSLLPETRSRWRKPSLTVWLSSTWCRAFMLPAVDGLRSWQEVQSWAASHFTLQQPPYWAGQAEFWMDEWNGRDNCLAVATDGALGNAIRERARATNLSLTAVRPWWSASLALEANGNGVADAMFANCPDGTTWIVGDSGAISGAGTWTPTPQGEAASSMRQRVLSSQQPVLPREVNWTPSWLGAHEAS